MITIAAFAGEIPRLHPRLLDNNYAQVAANTKLENGALLPIRNGRFAYNLSAPAKTIFLNGDDWLSWDTVVDVVTAPIANDRLYVTGDGVPKIIIDGATYPLAVQRPTKAVNVSVAGTIDTDLQATILYTYTWVTDTDEESEPADASTGVLWSPGLDVTLSGFDAIPTDRNIASMRIYRSQTSASGDTTFYFIKERGASIANFVDVVADNPIVEPIPSTDYNPPPDGLTGITALHNGMLAGFVGKKLYFCEPYKPHAWPEKYVLTMNYNIIGLGSFASCVAIMTDGCPYIAQGTAPENMTQERIDVNLPCINAQGIVDLGYSVAYPSPQGLVSISSSGAAVVSASLFTQDQWRSMSPETFIAAQYAGRYMAAYKYNDALGHEQKGIFIIDLTGAPPFLTRAADECAAMYFEIGTGRLFILRDETKIFEWDASSEPFGELLWRSKRYVLTTLDNFGCIMIEGEAANIYGDVATDEKTREENAELIRTWKTRGPMGDAAVGIVPVGGSKIKPLTSPNGGGTPTTDGSMPGVPISSQDTFSATVIADGMPLYTVYQMNVPCRLPSGILAKTWEIEIRGTTQVSGIILAHSPSEMAGG